ncbi:MAG: isocitrate lyase/PEP mutase family protein [Lentisphaerae bacterium]|jgi:2-methylisocitrate lyase-like PEP mutase family enzyme|nr:isocitrate lyase/PEP mutase family protein [Lentisphaerota bacterium]MBT4822289.1 isocitrate lyase/PEP mutase family protein [Lentisphaerota bacterium]MBT5612019.1 isocitrate lyase/PEP mutase family protein [Lentisphaerota bacterium]MBT7054767.1 isocitrate lyase/PEP mutase family protein [Lentisphaerota bacterium]MBT7846388.1 isocitrate lyase/PEP mutase family protein [Lentisphaerota bacterium]
MNQSQRIRELLESGDLLLMPDAYDPISARIIQRCGFEAVQCSGCSIAVANCLEREAQLRVELNLQVTRSIVAAVDVPVMADGEDGYGGPEEIGGTVAAFIDAGVAGINIEDQAIGNADGVAIIEQAVMVEKLHAAREAARSAGSPGLVINGRTDALLAGSDRPTGLDEAITRGNAYLQAGADMVFVTYIATLEEVREAVRGIDGPVSIAAGQPYNMQEFSVDDLRREGVARVSLPTLAILSSVQALKTALEGVRETQNFGHLMAPDRLCGWGDIANIVER